MRANNFKDISGNKYGRLTVIEFAGIGKENRAMWRCKCDCGNEIVVIGKSLRSGNTRSCGCLVLDDARMKNERYIKKHGKTDTRLFRVWASMKSRCYNPKAINYADYGGRGITICDEWSNNFEAFFDWALSQGYDPEAKRGQCTIERIDNAKGYTPDNCRFATAREQANNRRSTRFVTYNGIRRSLSEWARHYGRDISLFQHMSDEEIIQRIATYEAYKREHGAGELPKRVRT